VPVKRRRRTATTTTNRPTRAKAAAASSPEQENAAAQDSVPPSLQQGPASLNVFALGFEEEEVAEKKKPLAGGGRTGDRSSLQAKLASGRANENYIKVNIKKKTFVRGRRGGGAALMRAEHRRKIDLKVGDVCFKIPRTQFCLLNQEF
jgi:hypothetical protein